MQGPVGPCGPQLCPIGEVGETSLTVHYRGDATTPPRLSRKIISKPKTKLTPSAVKIVGHFGSKTERSVKYLSYLYVFLYVLPS